MKIKNFTLLGALFFAGKLAAETNYDILGIAKTATPEEIKKAYREKALECHPDKNLDNKKVAAELFKRVAAAYEQLSDETKRMCYDAELAKNSATREFTQSRPTQPQNTKPQKSDFYRQARPNTYEKSQWEKELDEQLRREREAFAQKWRAQREAEARAKQTRQAKEFAQREKRRQEEAKARREKAERTRQETEKIRRQQEADRQRAFEQKLAEIRAENARLAKEKRRREEEARARHERIIRETELARERAKNSYNYSSTNSFPKARPYFSSTNSNPRPTFNNDHSSPRSARSTSSFSSTSSYGYSSTNSSPRNETFEERLKRHRREAEAEEAAKDSKHVKQVFQKRTGGEYNYKF